MALTVMMMVVMMVVMMVMMMVVGGQSLTSLACEDWTVPG